MKVIIFLFCFYTTTLLVQGDYLKEINDLRTQMTLNSNGDVDALIEGSRYWHDDFEIGSVLMKDNSFFTSVLLRYDAYEERFEIQQQGKTFILPDAASIDYVVLGNDTIFSKISNKNKEEAYFFLVRSGTLRLFVKHTILLKKAEEPIGYQDAKPAQFVLRADEFYLGKEDRDLLLVSKKKEVLDFFYDERVNKFIKKEKLSLKKQGDLVQIVDYYNNIKRE